MFLFTPFSVHTSNYLFLEIMACQTNRRPVGISKIKGNSRSELLFLKVFQFTPLLKIVGKVVLYLQACKP